MIVHQDQDPVFASPAWTGRLLSTGARLSYARCGLGGDPEMGSFCGRFKVENRSLILDAESSKNSPLSSGIGSETTTGCANPVYKCSERLVDKDQDRRPRRCRLGVKAVVRDRSCARPDRRAC